ncbi:peptidase inhibitor family I36 protein [Streptomyces sp. HSW2009]|uniref:peptidase inhibitor family I36 protein n=1 Tax=Streptomyces sp. HSW2009 TaxID=3142890 RepID=UPI0032EEE17C
MKRTLVAGLAAVACMTATTVIGSATSASANPNDCPDGYVCVWGDINYEGRFLFAPGPERANVGSHMNDLTSSIWNRTGSQVCFYNHADWRGGVMRIVPAGGYLANVGPDANDTISSWRAC